MQIGKKNVYILDTNVFIEAKKTIYPMDIFPVYWDTLKSLASEGIVCSIDKVLDEIGRNEDTLTQWCKDNLTNSFFKISKTTDCLVNYKEIINWANGINQYSITARNNFCSIKSADAFLIAYVKSMPSNYILVTYEKSAMNSKYSIKIPDVCSAFSLKCIDPITMLRDLKVSFK